jgi:cardiolipin synthase
MPRAKQPLRSLYREFLSRSPSEFVAGNQVTLLQSGEAYFPAIESAFDQARHEIHLQTYIFEDDATGRRIARALVRAARRGVTVQVLIDGYGSKDLPRDVRHELRAQGVQVLVYGPEISPWTFRRERLRRMHRKIVVVDREIAFVGGINIIDDRTATSEQAPRYDFAVAVQGPLVDVIRLATRRLWSMSVWRSLHMTTLRDTEIPPSSFTGGSMRAAFLLRDNFHHRRDIEAAYLRAMAQARAEIILAHAYFLPGLNLRHALIDATGRGVRVILLLQGRVEHFLEHHASRALYGSLLDAGVEIHEYRKTFLHAKVAVIDARWATVGSTNLDPFSLLLSREANVIVDDEAFGATLTRSLKQTLASDGQQILPQHWQQQPITSRLLSWACYGLLRFSMLISGYARERERAGDR